jgi:hypothetical protein
MAFAKIPDRTEQEWKAFANYLKHPVDAVKDWFGVTPDDWQGDVLNGIFTNKDRSAYKAAHGVGKTTLDAWAGWIFLNGYEDARLVATAPTIHQLTDALWPEYAKWQDKMPARMKDEWSLSSTHIKHKDTVKHKYSSTWFATARTSNKPANLQGFHNEHLMIQGDEGSAIPENVFEVIEGTLSEAGDDGKIAKLLLGGNPNFTSGELYNAFNRNSDLYHCVTITGDPQWFADLNIKQGQFVPLHGHVYLSPRVRERYRTTMEKKYGIDSAIYDVRVRGIFPRAAEDVIIPFSWAEAAMMLNTPSQFDPVADGVTLVVDPSRGGGAETSIGDFRKGYCIKLTGHKVTSTTAIVTLVKERVLAITGSGQRLNTIIVDEPGIGGGVIDQLRAENLPVQPYNGGWPLVKGQDPDDDIRMFANRRARDWWHVRRLIEQGRLPLPHDEVLLAQMTTLKFHYRTNDQKIVCESKEDLKNRLGKEASPDRADVIVMGTAPWYSAAEVHGNLGENDVFFGETGDREFANGQLIFDRFL